MIFKNDVTFFAGAKLNLSLDVLSKMDDGYHEICSVMQEVLLHDDVMLSVKPGKGNICVRCSKNYLPRDEKNIAGKAVRLFLSEMNITGYNVWVNIKKRIPVCAGLGGGSSDGAAVLRGMNEIFDTRLSEKELEVLGERLGSDVPFCVNGGTSLAGGRGEKLTKLKAIPKCHVVICKPEFSVSTPELFSAIDSKKIRLHPDTDGMLTALNSGDLNGISKRLFNVFEELVIEDHSEIKAIKDILYDNNALGASMSGTGSAVFGLFDDVSKAKSAFYQLKQEYKECFLTETV